MVEDSCNIGARAAAAQVLNKARQAVPTDPSIWITAAKLEEAQGNNMVSAAAWYWRHWRHWRLACDVIRALVFARSPWQLPYRVVPDAGCALDCGAGLCFMHCLWARAFMITKVVNTSTKRPASLDGKALSPTPLHVLIPAVTVPCRLYPCRLARLCRVR
jgi:hypothetical protein